MELRGKVHEIGAVQQVSETFKKRDLIVEYAENPQYPEFLKFEAIQDKTALFDNLKVGDDVDVSFNLRGRAWTNKEGVTSYFNSMTVWRINTASGAAPANNAAPAASTPAFAPPAADISTESSDGDDLPF